MANNIIEEHFAQAEQRVLSGTNSPYWPITSVDYRDITIEWKPCPKKSGGTLKRKGVWGKLIYVYNNKELTRDEAIREVEKPTELRQALLEAQTILECSMCGKVVVGKEAMQPYRSVRFEGGNVIEQRQWGLLFYQMNPDRINEPQTLSICPDCMDKIAQGKFRKLWPS